MTPTAYLKFLAEFKCYVKYKSVLDYIILNTVKTLQDSVYFSSNLKLQWFNLLKNLHYILNYGSRNGENCNCNSSLATQVFPAICFSIYLSYKCWLRGI